MAEVPVTVFTDHDKLESGPPGGIQYYRNMRDEIAGLINKCPCGCGELGSISFIPEAGKASWRWNGNREKPTLEPSVLKTTGCHWHGFLTDGIWRSC